MGKFEPTNIKGASDFSPEQQIRRNQITDVLKRNFESYGYLPLETAMLNYYELLSYKYNEGAEILREIYKIKDQGDRDLGLRFDLTVPFCKFIAQNRSLRFPFKRYEIGKVFRNGPVKLGRAREFYQCDVDCVGVSGPHIEAEFVALAVKCYRDLGIDVVIKIGNRNMLADVIALGTRGTDASKSVATKQSRPEFEAIFSILDRIEKVSREQTLADLKRYGAEKLLGMKIEPNIELKELFAILDEMGLKGSYEFAPYLVRGLNIYTGTVWEAFDRQKHITSSLGGGGRYDSIIGSFLGENVVSGPGVTPGGQRYPAVGTSFGLEPICAILNSKAQESATCIDIIIVPMGTETAAQKFAENLRTQGLRVLVNLTGKSVGKALEYANAEKIPFAAVLGANELKSGEINIKNMSTGAQKAFRMNQALDIKEYVGKKTIIKCKQKLET